MCRVKIMNNKIKKTRQDSTEWKAFRLNGKQHIFCSHDVNYVCGLDMMNTCVFPRHGIYMLKKKRYTHGSNKKRSLETSSVCENKF